MNLTRPIVFLDLETTGLDLTNDRVIEICMIKILPAEEDKQIYYKRINPDGRQIHEEAYGKHKIKLEDLEYCPKFSDIASDVYDFIKECDLGGYNCKKFDIPILIEEFIRCKIPINIKSFKIIDVYKILSKAEPRTLEGTYKRFFNEQLEGAHGAEADINATIKILEKMESIYELPNTIDDLHNYSFEDDNSLDFEGKLKKNKDGEIIFNFGKYKDKTISDVFYTDKGYYDWIINNSDMTRLTKSIFKNILNYLNTKLNKQ